MIVIARWNVDMIETVDVNIIVIARWNVVMIETRNWNTDKILRLKNEIIYMYTNTLNQIQVHVGVMNQGNVSF